MTEVLLRFYFHEEKGHNKEEKRFLYLILGKSRNEEEDFYGRRFGVISGDLEGCGTMEDRPVGSEQ